MGNLFSEFRRRNVFRVGLAYIIVAWLIAQVADLALENFASPDWVIKTILLVLMLGLPIALVFAWAFEMTPDGLKLEKDVDRSQSTIERSGRKFDFAIIVLLAVALIYFVYESRLQREPVAGPSATAMNNSANQQGLPAKSIAVLPFVNLSGMQENEYFSDGLAETLLHMLAQIEELQVAARTSAFKFKGTNEDVRLVGKQLGVATVLEGSVQRAGNRIRITVQLINVEDGFHLWSQNYDRTLDDIFAVQDDIAASVVDALELTFLGRLHGRAGQDPATYDELLRLRDALAGGKDIAATIDNLQAFIEIHPDYVDAYATLSEAYVIHRNHAGLIPEEIGQKAIEAAREAVELDPEAPGANAALSRALVNQGLFVAAIPVLAKAMELEPGNADTIVDQATVMAARGQFQKATGLMELAIKLDPLNDNTRIKLSEQYDAIGRHDQALSVLEAGLELSTDRTSLVFAMALHYQQIGHYPDAVASLHELLSKEADHINAWQILFAIYISMGDLATAEVYLQRVEELSRDRGADERALFCYIEQDKACWRKATARMLATREAFFVQAWQSKMMLEDDRLDDAIAVMIPVVEHFGVTGEIYGNFESRINLAALYHFADDSEKRDRLLNDVTSDLHFSIDSGWEHSAPYVYLAMASAAMGDTASAVRNLDEAYGRGHRSLLWSIYTDYAWDPIRSDPEFQQAIQTIKDDNSTMLEQIRATDAGNR
ncbi:beta-barrel assembly-enhancing protease [bacterium MnTg04]|nr:beta-barrel assembly-enhancing protease [bacterium MnTg04]